MSFRFMGLTRTRRWCCGVRSGAARWRNSSPSWRRREIGIEACGASHHWARVLRGLGHEVLLMPPQYVKPYVQRGKNDAIDAERICQALSRPTLRLGPVKTAGSQPEPPMLGHRGLIREH